MSVISTENEIRINQAVDYVVSHLEEPLSVGLLAEVSCFSKFHFHRLFKAVTGESVNQFIKRQRMQRAFALLTYSRSLPVTEIASQCGFSSISNFSKAFSSYYHLAPSQIRDEFPIERLCDYASILQNKYGGHPLREKVNERMMQFFQTDYRQIIGEELYQKIHHYHSVVTEQVSPFDFMYLRHYGVGNDMNNARLGAKMFSMARQVWQQYKEVKCLSVIYERGTLTPDEFQRWDVAITIPEKLQSFEKLARSRLSGGLYATLEVVAPFAQQRLFWIYLVCEWLPATHYEMDVRPQLISYLPMDSNDPMLNTRMKLYLPVKV
jgi:AraC family transcriptional regulator